MSPVTGEGNAQIEVDPVLVDERELGVEVKQVLVRGAASDNCEKSAVRVLLEADVSVGEFGILDVSPVLEGEEALHIAPQSRDDQLFLGGDQVSGSS